jgi:hypothetical protein
MRVSVQQKQRDDQLWVIERDAGRLHFGHGQTILIEREKIKRQAIEYRRLQHRKSVA